MRKFDTKVQLLKYKVLREVARIAFDEGEFSLANNFNDIAKTVTSDKATMRCCIYKERAIVAERIKLACGGNRANPNIIEVIDIACDECPASGYQVSHDCRGCIAHRCESACRKGAISFDENQKAHIDKTKCVNCGQCAKVCPYSAISNYTRPCEKACKIKAISMADSEENPAQIDNNKCINCGACSYACPFGAIMDKSFILDAIRILKDSNKGDGFNVYAVVAPSIASQFVYAKLGQVVTAIKKLGFYSVVEAALGADIVAYSESKELAEKGFLTSSCCPAFVDYVKKFYPKLTENISHNLSPMAAIAKYIKETDETAKVIFIGPCTAKKAEAKQERVAQYVDCVLTFEELQALIDSRNIELTELPEDVLDNASYYGRIFARSGGVSEAVGQAIKEQNIDCTVDPLPCDGIEECKTALLKASRGILKNNFIEGMACVGGCIGGAGCLTHEAKDKNEIDKYGKEALEKSIGDALSQL